jgi:hypothetical protein
LIPSNRCEPSNWGGRTSWILAEDQSPSTGP